MHHLISTFEPAPEDWLHLSPRCIMAELACVCTCDASFLPIALALVAGACFYFTGTYIYDRYRRRSIRERLAAPVGVLIQLVLAACVSLAVGSKKRDVAPDRPQPRYPSRSTNSRYERDRFRADRREEDQSESDEETD